MTSPIPDRPPCRDECAALLRTLAHEFGTDVTVSAAPPLIAGPYTGDGFTCPHGVTWFLEPTSEQIATWTRDGTP